MADKIKGLEVDFGILDIKQTPTKNK